MSNIIKAREIFAVGTWNGIKFTLADLKQIAKNFGALSKHHSVPLKLGHNKKQPLTDGQPALGWVTRVFVEGQKLLADFSDVPDVVMRAIQKRRFTQVSIELVREGKINGSVVRNVLDAVSLLGADLPAVKGLKDLDKFMQTGQRLAFADASLVEFSFKPGAQAMDEEEVKKLIALAVEPLQGQIVTLTKERDAVTVELNTLKTADETRNKDERTTLLTAAKKRVDEMFNQAIEAKVILPAARVEFTAAFSLEDEEKLLAMKDEDFKRVEGIVNPDGKKKDETGETTERYFSKPSADQTGGESVQFTDKTSDGNLVFMTDKYLAEHPEFYANDPERYTKASELMMRQHPELAKVYVMGNG